MFSEATLLFTVHW